MARRIDYIYPYDYCPIDGCYRQTVNHSAYCARHYQTMMRYGTPWGKIGSYTVSHDWVSDPAGPECRICGRSVYKHGVVEFCQLKLRAVS